MSETHTGIWEDFGTIEWKVGFFLTTAQCVSIEPLGGPQMAHPQVCSTASISAIPVDRGTDPEAGVSGLDMEDIYLSFGIAHHYGDQESSERPLSPCGSLGGLIAPVQLTAPVAFTSPVPVPRPVSSPLKYASSVPSSGSLPLSGPRGFCCLHSVSSSLLREGCSPAPRR